MDQEEFLSLDGSRMRAAIAEQTQEFLARGGKITQCKPNASSKKNMDCCKDIHYDTSYFSLGDGNLQKKGVIDSV